MSETMKTLNHTYSIELCFFGDELRSDDITRCLSLQATRSSDGLLVRSDGRKRVPFWAYNGQGEEGFQLEWESLENGLWFLLRKLTPLQPEIIRLSKIFEGYWRCGHFQTSFDGGPVLSSKVLAEVAGYGLPLSIDNYFSSPVY